MSLACPNCGCKMSHVQRTYPRNILRIRNKMISSIKRRRICRHCGTGYYSIERTEEDIIRDEELPAQPPRRVDDDQPFNPFIR